MLAACSRQPEARVRFLFWAKYVSRQVRTEALQHRSVRFDEVESLQRQFKISDREVQAILVEAQREHWADSHECQPAPEPYRMNGLLWPPEPDQPLVGVPTAESCRRRLQGTVIVSAIIRRSGRATGATILKSLGPELDAQAIGTVEAMSWLPALLCGRPADAYFIAAVPFTLSSCGGT